MDNYFVLFQITIDTGKINSCIHWTDQVKCVYNHLLAVFGKPMLALLDTDHIAEVFPFAIFDSIRFICNDCAILHSYTRSGFGLNITLGVSFAIQKQTALTRTHCNIPMGTYNVSLFLKCE